MNEIDKAIEELQDMAFHPSLKKELSAETLTMAIVSLEKMKSAKTRREIDETEFREVLLKASTTQEKKRRKYLTLSSTELKQLIKIFRRSIY